MILIRIFSIIAVIFGFLTIRSGGSVIFGDPDAAKEFAGNYVGFVVWFNTISGFGYIIAGIGLWMRKNWAMILAIILALGISIVFIALGIHIQQDGPYEMRTIKAMVLRLALWLILSGLSYRQFVKVR